MSHVQSVTQPTSSGRPPAIPSPYQEPTSGTIQTKNKGPISYNVVNGKATINNQPLEVFRDGFLSQLPKGPIVDLNKANSIVAMLNTPPGAAVINYFDSNS